MKRFLPWLVPITLLLAAVPVLLMSNSAGMAKTVGIIMMVVTTVALRFWLFNAGKLRRYSGRVLFTINERYFLNEHYPYYRSMPNAERRLLEERAGMLLAELSFDRYDHTEASREECLAFSVVLATLIPKGIYKHAVNKVVVFREELNTEVSAQGENQLIFINANGLKQALQSSPNGELAKAQSPETVTELLKFYHS